MIVLPLLLLLKGSAPIAQQNQTVFQRVIEQADPNNGYDEYVRAVDLERQRDMDMYANWTPDQYASRLQIKKDQSYDWTPSDERRLALAKHLHDLDYLGVQREASSKFQDVLMLVRTGNSKRVWDPRGQVTAESIFPELADFRTVARLISHDVTVKFADGDSREGVKEFLDGLLFCEKTGGGLLISNLVSIAGNSILLADFQDRLPQLGEASADDIVKFTDEELARPSPFLAAIAGERRFSTSAVEDLLKSPGKLKEFDISDGAASSLGKYLSSASPSELEQVRSGFEQTIDNFYRNVGSRLNGPEAGWAGAPAGNMPPLPEAIANSQDAADALANMVTPAFEQAISAVLRHRAQLRLLDLHARIIRYRWRNNKLPAQLSEVAPESLIFDSFSNSEFQYEVTETGYRLYSKGSAESGRVELRYRRPLGSGGSDEVPPPSLPYVRRSRAVR